MVTTALWRDGIRPAAATVGAVWAVAAAAAGVRALQGDAAVGDPLAWLRVVALAVPASCAIAFPAGAAVATTAALSRWTDEGAWAGLRASGVSGRRLVPGAVAIGLVAGAATLAATTTLEPDARRVAKRVAAEAAAELRLWPGHPLQLGDVAVIAGEVGDDGARDVFFATRDAVGTARRARIDGDVAVLEDGVVATEGGRLSFGRWRRELPTASSRVELAERRGADLRDVIARTEADGRDASYERAVLYKRWLHPLAALLLPVATLPFGAWGRSGLRLGATALGYLVAVRAGDHLTAAIGPLAAASGPAFVAAVGAIAWARWGDR